jgi:hypothetical protein
LILYLQRKWWPFRVETFLLAGLAVLYGVCVLWLTPDFLGRVMGLVTASYEGFGSGVLIREKEQQRRLILLLAFSIGPVLAHVVARDNRPLTRLLLLGALTSLLIVVIQGKYWRYHFIATNGLCILVGAMALQKSFSVAGAWFPKAVIAAVLAGFIWLGVAGPTIDNLKSKGQPVFAPLQGIVDREPLTSHIAILSVAPDYAFLPLARAGRPHWSRHFSMWMMPGLLAPRADTKDAAIISKERDLVLSEFTQDLMCAPPDLIVGEVGFLRDVRRTKFDAMAFLTTDPAFAQWLNQNYNAQAPIRNFQIWRPKGTKPAPSGCPTPR